MDIKIAIKLIILLCFFSCNTNSRKVNSFESVEQNQQTENFTDFLKGFESVKLPIEINDSIIWKSTYVEMRGLDKIDTSLVNIFMNYEYETIDTIKFHELITFYRVGKIEIDSAIIGLIYLKSFKSRFVQGGKKDIYKVATFNCNGNLIFQKNLAGYITDYSKNDDRSFWNTCRIDEDFKIELEIKEELADYALDTLYLISKTTKNFHIDKEGIIIEDK